MGVDCIWLLVIIRERLPLGALKTQSIPTCRKASASPTNTFRLLNPSVVTLGVSASTRDRIRSSVFRPPCWITPSCVLGSLNRHRTSCHLRAFVHPSLGIRNEWHHIPSGIDVSMSMRKIHDNSKQTSSCNRWDSFLLCSSNHYCCKRNESNLTHVVVVASCFSNPDGSNPKGDGLVRF